MSAAEAPSPMPTSSQGDDGQLTFNIYGYVPSLAAGIVFIVLFSLITLIQLGYLIKSRTWWLVILLLGGIGEILGWAGRLWSALEVYQLNPFLIQICCLILAPCFYSATLYASLGAIIRVLDTGLQYTVIRPRNYLILFCTADLIAIVIQAVGGGMAATALQNDEESDVGTHIMMSLQSSALQGVVIQLAAMIAFCILGLIFWVRVRRDSGHARKAETTRVNWLALSIVWASVWILIRCIYRTIELAEGWTGYLITHEPYFWALDSIPMVLTQGVFLLAWPPFCLAPRNGTNSLPEADLTMSHSDDLNDTTTATAAADVGSKSDSVLASTGPKGTLTNDVSPEPTLIDMSERDRRVNGDAEKQRIA